MRLRRWRSGSRQFPAHGAGHDGRRGGSPVTSAIDLTAGIAPSRVRDSLRRSRDGQPLATLGTTPTEDRSTRFGLHPLSKPVSSPSANPTGLIGSFHGEYPGWQARDGSYPLIDLSRSQITVSGGTQSARTCRSTPWYHSSLSQSASQHTPERTYRSRKKPRRIHTLHCF